MEDSFYYVYEPSSNKPKFKHPSYEAALEEAKRLAETTQNEHLQFFVLKAVAICSYKRPVEVKQMDDIHF